MGVVMVHAPSVNMRRMETHITFQEGISQERKALIRGLIKRDLRKGGHKMSQEGINA